MTMRLEVNGQEYQGFTSTQVDLRLDALCNAFSFTAVSEEGAPLPFVGGEACRIIVDGIAVLTGTIEEVEVSYGPRDHMITLRGRDRTSDLVDSNLLAINDIRGEGLTLQGLIEEVIEQLGSDLKVVDEAGTLLAPFNAAEDVTGPDLGQNAFEFIEKYSKKRQVLLTSNSAGDVLITQSSGTAVKATLQSIVGSDTNNIKEATGTYSTVNRYRNYTFASSQSFVALNSAGSTDLAEAVDQSGGTTDDDPTIRDGRQFVLVPETAASSDQNIERAKWEANVRQARGRNYSAVVEGFRNQTGDLWRINTLVSVVDEFAGINSQMLINTVSFSFDIETGSTTSLSLLPSNAYTVTLEEPKTETVGSGLFG